MTTEAPFIRLPNLDQNKIAFTVWLGKRLLVEEFRETGVSLNVSILEVIHQSTGIDPDDIDMTSETIDSIFKHLKSGCRGEFNSLRQDWTPNHGYFEKDKKEFFIDLCSRLIYMHDCVVRDFNDLFEAH